MMSGSTDVFQLVRQVVGAGLGISLRHTINNAALAGPSAHEVDDGVADVLLRGALAAYDGNGVAAMACRCEGVFVAQTPSTRLAACGAPGAAMAWGA